MLIFDPPCFWPESLSSAISEISFSVTQYSIFPNNPIFPSEFQWMPIKLPIDLWNKLSKYFESIAKIIKCVMWKFVLSTILTNFYVFSFYLWVFSKREYLCMFKKNLFIHEQYVSFSVFSYDDSKESWMTIWCLQKKYFYDTYVWDV